MLSRRRLVPFVVLLLVSLVAVPSTFAQPPLPTRIEPAKVRQADGPLFVPGQVLVRLHDRSTLVTEGADALTQLQARFPGMGIEGYRKVTSTVYRLNVAENADIEALAAQISADPAVDYAQPNYMRYALRGVNDPLSTFQWALGKINAYGAWDVTTGSNIVVAVLDSGVNPDHPDLRGRVLPGYDFISNDSDARDEDFHGTNVAGIIAAAGDNGEGVAGMCWQCQILPLRVIGSRGGSDENVVDGIEWALDNGARIINMSLGGPGNSRILREAVQEAARRNVLVVAAAGNEAEEGNPVEYPAAYDEVLAVGATDEADQRAYFSQIQPYVDISAPGWNIPSTAHELDLDAYGAYAGTSFSAPYVSGLAALLLSINPSLDANALREILVTNVVDLGQPGLDWEYGFGRIDAARAVNAVRIPAFEPVANPNQEGVAYFPETQHTVRGRMRSFWEQNGGLPVFGFPISEEFSERTPEGTFTVQYFERNRLELHPENPAPYDVLLGRLSDTLLQRQGRNWFTFPKGTEQPGCQFFAETQHTVCEPFLSYWRNNGLSDPALNTDQDSLALFGLPLSEPAPEVNSSGENVVTQWFERARFEFHPDKAPEFQVLLGLLGNEGARPGATGPAPSGQTPPSRCDGVPASVNASIQPSNCFVFGTLITINAKGFTPREPVGFYVSLPTGEAIELDTLNANSSGELNLFGTLPLPDGFYGLTMEGIDSGNTAIVYMRIVER
jgi:thermitase